MLGVTPDAPKQNALAFQAIIALASLCVKPNILLPFVEGS
jgi:hypothetical protein